ncbi:hypothetical protein C1645_826559 [Glomus cerebriforme]|uniref:MADF domain-containing protein n=1 Tax=Glomus cerebriforme TaxID=658196 RepID=A0A397STP7_9GLOM|nr:hypothetical protein C1645_826559 [Glomus cerebriforme]
MAANNIPQSRTINYNQVRVLWTDEKCLYLLNQRMARNDEYWKLDYRNKMEYWRSITVKINNCFETRFMALQTKQKWKNLLREYLIGRPFGMKYPE